MIYLKSVFNYDFSCYDNMTEKENKIKEIMKKNNKIYPYTMSKEDFFKQIMNIKHDEIYMKYYIEIYHWINSKAFDNKISLDFNVQNGNL